MNNYQLLIEYEGTNFVGWQIQNNGLSVQEVIEQSLKKIIKNKIILIGSGRTDAGVHAIEQSAHFKTRYIIKNKVKFVKSINFFLSKHKVSILRVKKKKESFHSRHSAKIRIYKYIIINREAPLALENNRAWNIKKKLDINLMKKGALILKGTKDFSTFRAASCSAKSPIKSLTEAKVKKTGNVIELQFISRSFLQQQVRSMVGCLKYLGENKWNLNKSKQVMISKKRSSCAPPAPPQGLYLLKVKY